MTIQPENHDRTDYVYHNFDYLILLCLLRAEVNIGFVDDAIVVSEPINFTVSVVLFQNNLDPGTEISLSLVGRDGIAAGTVLVLQYGVLNGLWGCGLLRYILFMFPAQSW